MPEFRRYRSVSIHRWSVPLTALGCRQSDQTPVPATRPFTSAAEPCSAGHVTSAVAGRRGHVTGRSGTVTRLVPDGLPRSRQVSAPVGRRVWRWRWGGARGVPASPGAPAAPGAGQSPAAVPRSWGGVCDCMEPKLHNPPLLGRGHYAQARTK